MTSPEAQQQPAASDSVMDSTLRQPESADVGNQNDAAQNLYDKVHGQPFIVDSVQFKEGILEFRQGKDFLADKKITVFLFIKNTGILPEEQSFAVETDSGTFNNPHVHISWKEEGSGRIQTESFTKDYSLQLAFGTEQQHGKLPLSISLKLPGEHESVLNGEFVADVKGFRIIDGKVDLTADSFKTLIHVAQTQLEATHGGDPVEILNSRDGRFTNPSANLQQSGWYDVEYRVGGSASNRAKIIFLKGQDGWKVHEVLKPHQLFAAHPVRAPDGNSRPHESISYAVAKHVEAELVAKSEKQPIRGTGISVSHNSRTGYGKATVRYQIGEETDRQQKAFVLRNVDGRWIIEKEMDPTAKVDLRTGKVKEQ